jgi:hypothetical protein
MGGPSWHLGGINSSKLTKRTNIMKKNRTNYYRYNRIKAKINPRVRMLVLGFKKIIIFRRVSSQNYFIPHSHLDDSWKTVFWHYVSFRKNIARQTRFVRPIKICHGTSDFYVDQVGFSGNNTDNSQRPRTQQSYHNNDKLSTANWQCNEFARDQFAIGVNVTKVFMDWIGFSFGRETASILFECV